MTDGAGLDPNTEQASTERRALDRIEVELGQELARLYQLERTLHLRIASSGALGLTPDHRARAIRSGLALGKRLDEQRIAVKALARAEKAAQEKYCDAVGEAISRAKRAQRRK